MTMQPPPVYTRFAPSPTGELHLGHAFSACFAARAGGGQFILRIDDLDHTRCKPAFTKQIFDDLAWLGLKWQEPVRYQSDRLDATRRRWRHWQKWILSTLLSQPYGSQRSAVSTTEPAPPKPACRGNSGERAARE